MSELHDRLDRLAHDPAFTPPDLAQAAAQGRRALRERRRRRIGTAVAGAAALSMVAFFGWDTVAGNSLDFGDPVGLPASSGIPTAQAYADLVQLRRGGDFVEIQGVGWPIESMAPVSGPAGTLRLPAIDRRGGEAMCLPMLEQAAPEVPGDEWRHSSGGIENFPLRATLSMVIEAEYEGVTYSATCALPGDRTPATRPDLTQVPDPTRDSDDQEVLAQCSYLAHVDFSAWDVVAGTGNARGASAVLASQDGYLATCVLAAEPAGRAVRISERTDPPTVEDPLVYDSAARIFSVAGRAPADATSVTLKVGGQSPVTSAVTGEAFAIAAESASSPDPVARLTAYDAAGVEVASWTTTARGPVGSLLPTACFYTAERDRGAC